MAAKKPATSKPKAKKGQAEKDRKAKAKSATKGTKPVKRAEAREEKVRKVWGGQPLRDFASAIINAQNRASTAGGAVGQLITAKVKEKGLNGPAFRLALRVLKTAQRDPGAGRVFYDDIIFYLDELKVDDECSPRLFKAREGAADGPEDEDESEGESETTELPDGVTNLADHRETEEAA